MPNVLPYDAVRTFSTPVDPAFGFSRVELKLDVPTFAAPARLAGFAAHEVDIATQETTKRVLATFRGGFALSEDLGESWQTITLPVSDADRADGFLGYQFENAFFTAAGSILLQVKAPPKLGGRNVRKAGAVMRFNAQLELEDVSEHGSSHWHGTRSIDQKGQTIMYAEYPNNKQKYRVDHDTVTDPAEHDLRTPTVYRSRDDGRTWQKVFEVSWREIRHFHTLAADPYEDHTWWLSSGDQANECRVWKSTDDGDTWVDVTTPEFEVELHPGAHPQSSFRYTDLWIGKNEMIWGTDDWMGGVGRVNSPDIPLGRRAGSCVFRVQKTDRLVGEKLAYVGNPVRSIIDVGPAFVLTTEAKRTTFPRPQVMLVSKADPHLCTELFSADVFGSGGTGFTFSRASRSAHGNCFFSYRTPKDIFQNNGRVLRWTIDFLQA